MMARIAIALALLAGTAFAEHPHGIEDYFARFQAASRRHAGVAYPRRERVRFELGITPYLPREPYLGEKWWFATHEPDAICLYEGVDRQARLCRAKMTIAFDTRTWRRSDDLYREMLVFHELGHCALRLDHDPSHIEKEKWIFPLSVMYPGPGPFPDTYLVNREFYHEKLFRSLNRTVEKIEGRSHGARISRRFSLARRVRRNLAGNRLPLIVTIQLRPKKVQ